MLELFKIQHPIIFAFLGSKHALLINIFAILEILSVIEKSSKLSEILELFNLWRPFLGLGISLISMFLQEGTVVTWRTVEL